MNDAALDKAPAQINAPGKLVQATPDWSPGDVIAAYPDGTIVLDDGVTTWNPQRAEEFLNANTCKCRYPDFWGGHKVCGNCGKLAQIDAPEAEHSNSGLVDYLRRQWEWSKRTFGPGKRTLGITEHISKELAEIRANPEDLSEWIDVVILALDGYWRHGGKPEDLMAHLQAKQDQNFARQWPTPVSEDVAVEHDRNAEQKAPEGK